VATGTLLRTEYPFTLPRGYVDERGDVHRQGLMRLATALDEVEPLGDPRVRANEAYLGILVLSRVIARLGDLAPVGPAVVERLFAADFTYLQELYIRVNELPGEVIETHCPSCGTRFALDLTAAQSPEEAR
jgi:hypothetical protein